MARITVYGITKEDADSILYNAYEADRTAVYADSGRAVHGTQVLAVATYFNVIPQWGVEIISSVYSESTLVEMVPVELRSDIVERIQPE